MKKGIIIWNTMRSRMSNFLTPVPEVEEDYVDKVVYLLRRDFDPEQQNQIIFSIGTKLSKLRDEDMAQLEKDYANLQEYNNTLKHRLAIQ